MPTFLRLSAAQRQAFLAEATVREVPATRARRTRRDRDKRGVHSSRARRAGIAETDGYRVLSVMGPGDVFGEIAALTAARHSDVVAVEPTTLLEVPASLARRDGGA